MARKSSSSDPALSIDFFFSSGFYTYRSQLFAPFKGIGVNVVSFHDPVIDGLNFELTDKLEWSRRPGFSIFCPIPLADSEIVNQFYSSRDLNGDVFAFVDTSARLATFSQTGLNNVLTKTTKNQGYISTIGNRTYYADGASADLYAWDGTNLAKWGLPAPTITPTSTGMGFWQPYATWTLGQSILDTNGDVETITAILIPNGAFKSPTTPDEISLAGSLSLSWGPESVHGGYSTTDGYQHIQQAVGYSQSTNSVTVTLPNPITDGNVLVLSFGYGTTNFIPTVVSVTDNLGNTYTQQVTFSGVYYGGGGNSYYSNQWIWSAPIIAPGACTITVVTSSIGNQITVHEFSGISDTATTTNSNFVVHSTVFNTGTVSFTGTQVVFSSMLLFSTSPGTPPAGFNNGAFIGDVTGLWGLYDAYEGLDSGSSPTWNTPAGNGETNGLTVVFPITNLATGYTPYLFLRDFNFAIPAGATITGIAVNIPKFNSGTGTVQDQSVRLVIGGVVVGTDEAAAGAWSNSGYSVSSYGGSTDLWGLTPSAADINTNGPSGFGLAISANITDITGGSVTPEVGFIFPNQPTITIYFKQASGFGGPGVSSTNEPVWPTSINSSVNDGGVSWTNYGNIQTWFPVTGYPTPVVILDTNGYLQLSTYVANPIPAWDDGATYMLGDIVYFGGQYWISVFNGSNTGVVPTVNYATTGSDVTVPYWALTTTPLVTGIIAPVWNETFGGKTTDGSYTWTNIGQGTGLAFMGYAYVYGYRTVYGHISTCSPFSNNTGAILGPLNASIDSFSITSNVVTFTGNNNFQIGNVFEVLGLSTGTYLNNNSFKVLESSPSTSFPLTSVAVDGSDVLTIEAINNLVAGQTVTFSGVGTATFLNGVTVTVLSGGLSGTQFTANFTHASYGPTGDTGTVDVNGSYSAAFDYADVALTLDSGTAIPLISTITGVGTSSVLCNSVATITAVQVSANIVTVTASNNFQPGLWVTIDELTGASFLNGQQFQVTAVDQLIGTQNTWFQIFFETPNYMKTSDNGTATFNAVEIYRTSDGGGSYLFDGAVTNPGDGIVWTYNDFVVDDDLDALIVAPLSHQNDPPPGAPGSLVLTTGTIIVYWQGRLWMVVGNYVYFDAGPDCTNGIPEEAWPPAYRFQYAGPVMNLVPTPDGVGLLVYLADRVNVILGGPETISFYSTDALSNFGIANPNAIFRDGSTIGQFTTQKQYIELIDKQKQDIGEHIADYFSENFNSVVSQATLHRDGLDVGVFVSNGVDQVVRFGNNISAWSVPYFPTFGAGAVRSIETSAGVYSLMIASPTGGVTTPIGLINPTIAVTTGTGTAWVNPENILIGNPTDYATVTFVSAGTSQFLRASGYIPLNIPNTAIVQGVQVTLVGEQSETSGDISITITPTNPVSGATTYTFSLGTSNTTVNFGGVSDLWGMPWSRPYQLNAGLLSFDIVATTMNPDSDTETISISEVQVTVTYQNPGNYLYARDLNSWGDGGTYSVNNGTPYEEANIVIGSITLSQPGAPLFPLQHVVGYFDAVGTLDNGGPSSPDIWILPNEISADAGIGFVYLPEIIQEPPIGQNHPSKSLLALRWPVDMMNSQLASQYVHHMQVKIQFEPENAPNTIKALAFMRNQDT